MFTLGSESNFLFITNNKERIYFVSNWYLDKEIIHLKYEKATSNCYSIISIYTDGVI